MHFELTADQKLLESTVASFVKKESPITRFRATREEPLGYSKELWAKMGELGVDTAYKAVKGESVQPTVDTGTEMVTSENAAQFK